MKKPSAILIAAAALGLSACGGSAENGENADDFASRIGGSNSDAPRPQGTVAPQVQEAKAGAAPGPYVPGTQTDPDSACNAPKVGEFIGQPANGANQIAIMDAIGGSTEVRFVRPGGTFIKPDPTSPRLNLMLDQQGVIRDARCG